MAVTLPQRPATRPPAGPVCRPTLREERRLWGSGHRWVAGLDEVGRGAWAGPVSVGVAVVSPGRTTRSMPAWLRDSKMLSEERREAIYPEVAAWCADGAVGHASAEECDRLGMRVALRRAALRALAALELPPDAVLVDGPHDLLRPDPEPAQAELPFGGAVAAADPCERVARPATVVPVVDGDAHCAAVAAASILAKVVRDRRMRAEAEHFPAYGFERNKGYPSPAHQAALLGYGLSSIHRRSWAFVDSLPLATRAPRFDAGSGHPGAPGGEEEGGGGLRAW